MGITDVIAIVLFSLTLTIDLTIDVRKWKVENYDVNHKKKWIRGFGLIPAIVLLSLSNWWLLIPSIFMILFYYWFGFDGIYNLARKFNFWFTGSDDHDDAETDDFLQNLKPWQHKTIKIGGMIASTVAYVLVR